MNRIYRLLLYLYPRDFRASMGDEMLRTLDQREGSSVAECFGLVRGAVREWRAKLTSDPLTRERALRPQPVNDGSLPDEVFEAQQRVSSLVRRIVHAIATHDFNGARTFSYEETREREHLRVLRDKYGLGE